MIARRSLTPTRIGEEPVAGSSGLPSRCPPTPERQWDRRRSTVRPRSCHGPFPLAIGLGLLASVLSAADWPQWRGPQRNGISPETGLLKEWPPAGPQLLWRAGEIGA